MNIVVSYGFILLAAMFFYMGVRILLLNKNKLGSFVGGIESPIKYIWGDNKIDGIHAVKGGAINKNGEIIIKSSHSKTEMDRLFDK